MTFTEKYIFILHVITFVHTLFRYRNREGKFSCVSAKEVGVIYLCGNEKGNFLIQFYHGLQRPPWQCSLQDMAYPYCPWQMLI